MKPSHLKKQDVMLIVDKYPQMRAAYPDVSRQIEEREKFYLDFIFSIMTDNHRLKAKLKQATDLINSFNGQSKQTHVQAIRSETNKNEMPMSNSQARENRFVNLRKSQQSGSSSEINIPRVQLNNLTVKDGSPRPRSPDWPKVLANFAFPKQFLKPSSELLQQIPVSASKMQPIVDFGHSTVSINDSHPVHTQPSSKTIQASMHEVLPPANQNFPRQLFTAIFTGKDAQSSSGIPDENQSLVFKKQSIPVPLPNSKYDSSKTVEALRRQPPLFDDKPINVGTSLPINKMEPASEPSYMGNNSQTRIKSRFDYRKYLNQPVFENKTLIIQSSQMPVRKIQSPDRSETFTQYETAMRNYSTVVDVQKLKQQNKKLLRRIETLDIYSVQ